MVLQIEERLQVKGLIAGEVSYTHIVFVIDEREDVQIAKEWQLNSLL